MQDTWFQSLGWEDPLEKEIATHSSILAWESHGQSSLAGYSPCVERVGRNLATKPSPNKWKILATQSCLTLCDPMDCSLPGSSVHGIPRQEYWSGLPFPSLGDLPHPGTEPMSPDWQVDSLLLSHQGLNHTKLPFFFSLKKSSISNFMSCRLNF